MVLLFPMLSFFIGYFGVNYLTKYRSMMAMILAKVLIPLIIIYNMVFYQQGSIWLMLFSFCSSVVIYLIVNFFYKDRIQALCASYLNMAWLGFPFAFAVFGAAASSPMVALYVGGSIFGNLCAIMALSTERQSVSMIVRKLGGSPPIIALGIAAVLSLWDLSEYQFTAWVQTIYAIDKWLMTFAGMCILGMWLSKIRIHFQDVWLSFQVNLLKFIFGSICCFVAYLILPIPHQTTLFAIMLMFFLLPPAANIVALETHYLRSGISAQYIAAGTIVSCITIGIFAMLYHGFIV